MNIHQQMIVADARRAQNEAYIRREALVRQATAGRQPRSINPRAIVISVLAIFGLR